MLTEKGTISHREVQRVYKLTDKGKETQTKYYHSEAKREANARYRSRNKWRTRIHNIIKRAKKLGLLLCMPCELCEKPNAFAHHDDYSKPLEVRWLCNYHHCEHHKREGR